MKPHSTHSTLATICFLALVLAALGAAASTLRQTQQIHPNVVNNTRALAVVGLVETRDGIEFSLQNVSTKPINGYSVGFGGGIKQTVDLSVGDRVIGPGENVKINVPFSQLRGSNVTVLDVIFEDDTAEGDTASIAELKDRRRGVREQLARIRPLLEAAAAGSPDADALTKLKAQVAALSEGEEGHSVYVRAGLRNAKEDVLMDVSKLQRNDGNVQIQTELRKIMDRNAKRLMRLSRNSP